MRPIRYRTTQIVMLLHVLAPPLALVSALHQLQLVKGGDESQRWRQYVEQHHYLGCPVPYGAHLRYWVRHEGRVLACLLWTSPAWRMKPRDTWIGWTDQQRQQNL